MNRTKPRIAILLDESTSSGGSKYELSKSYFSCIAAAGGTPYGISYLKEFIGLAPTEFDGFFSVGGAIAFPEDWYVTGQASPYAHSERLEVELGIAKGFLNANKPYLGSCHGTQILAGLYGGKLRSDLEATHRHNAEHSVKLQPGSRFAQIVGCDELTVNSWHREAVVAVNSPVQVAALAPDGVIEAVEIPDKRFAVAYQWHQEAFWDSDHPGNKIFSAFVAAFAIK